jgi:hypothetical protein
MNSEMKNKNKKNFKVRYRFPPNSDPTRPKELLFKALYVLPEEVLDYFHDRTILFCWDSKGSSSEFLRFNTKKDDEFEFIIHFSSCIWDYTDDEILGFILIQIAHCYLDNESGFWSLENNKDFVPDKEFEAQQLANKWVQNYVKKKFDLDKASHIHISSNLNAKQADNRFIEYYG